MRCPDLPTALAVLGTLCVGALLVGCTAQVSGMQSPVLHDYGPVEWIALDRQLDQPFISGPGYSAAVQNDPRTTPQQYLGRHANLPADARDGVLNRIRLGLRADGLSGGWDTGARVQILPSGFPVTDVLDVAEPLVDLALDDLERSDDMVIIEDLGSIDSGHVLVLRIIPGDGPDGNRLEIGITPHRAPYGGWRAVADGETQLGALVYDTRYERDVDLRALARSAGERVRDAGTGLLALYGILASALSTAAVAVWRASGRSPADGR